MNRNANKGLTFVVLTIGIILIFIALWGATMWWADYQVHK